MNPAFSVLFFTTLSGAGFGLWAWLGLRIAFGAPPQNFQALERVHQAHLSDDEHALSHAVNIAELEVAQSQTIVSDLIIKASGDLFDALSASATLKPLGLDRFWRNARTLSSHNPRIYKSRIVGDFAVNGTPPPAQWRIGVA